MKNVNFKVLKGNCRILIKIINFITIVANHRSYFVWYIRYNINITIPIVKMFTIKKEVTKNYFEKHINHQLIYVIDLKL